MRRDPRDRIRDAIDSTLDGVADATGKERTGFEPSVCETCPFQGGPPLKRCGKCGCPTLAGLGLDQAQMTPEDCPDEKQREHERLSG